MNPFIVQGIEQNLIRKINKRKSNNMAKHLRIANATTEAEREKHLLRADKLLSRYAPEENDKVDGASTTVDSIN